MRQDFEVLAGKPYPAGMSVTGKNEVNFSVVLRTREECGVVLYPKRGGEEIRIPFGRSGRIGNIFCMRLSGIRPYDYEYNFYVKDEVITDPYAKRICGNERWGAVTDPKLKGAVCSGEFDWENDVSPRIPLHESILYLLHVRGFTKHASSRVKHKGTFLGITEKIPYLKALGITAVELMPSYEFVELETQKNRPATMQEAAAHYMDRPAGNAETPRINYWGYKKSYYFAPKASYASGKDPGLEFKMMVKSLHKEGLEVILQFYFPKEVKPGYILEVLKYWVCEYHIDGIHLLGENIPTALIATDPLFSGTKLFYYDFDCSKIYDSPDVPDYKNLACYRDDFLYDMRHFLKGDEGMLSAALYQFKKNPGQTGSVNYITNYEGFCLADLVSYDRKHNEANGEENQDGNPDNASWNCGVEGRTKKKQVLSLRIRQMKNAMLLLLFSQGTPMIVSGDEFCQSRDGNNNIWCQDNAVGWLNWNNAEKNREFLSFVKEAIALRMAHPILHMPDELTMMDFAACGYPDLSYHGKEAWRLSVDRTSREAGIMYCGCYAKVGHETDDDFFYIACNMHWEERQLALPALPAGLFWEKVLESAEPSGTEEEAAGRTLAVPGRSIRIYKSAGERTGQGKKPENATAF